MSGTQSSSATPQRSQESESRINPVVFYGAAAAIILITIWALADATGAESVLGTMVGWITDWFGWFYIALATSVLVFVIYLASSRFGKIRLGPEHSRPEFSNFSWAAMLFAAGIGTDLMFFAVAEPAAQFMAPPSTEPESVDAARESIAWTLFHYGISGWGMYALMGIALAYFAYRLNLPLAVRYALRPILGNKTEGPLGDAVDLAAILGTVFGVATTLGIAVVQLNFGLNMLFPSIPDGSTTVQIVLLSIGVGMATISAVSGVERGIKWLSLANVLLAIGLAVFIVLAGKTTYFLNALVLNIGDFVRLFPDMTMQTFAYEDTGTWVADWTLFFWAWWIAWASFVGLFLARISRGRTIRQFALGTLVIPFSYILMWISIFGNATLDQIRSGNVEFGEIAMNTPEAGFYTLLTEYPAFTFVAGLATFVALLFYVTSADSGALVMANLSCRMRNVHADGPSWMRVFWAIATGGLTVALLTVGGITSLQYATIVMGLPFAFVMLLVMFGLHRALRDEAHLVDAHERTANERISSRRSSQGVTWQRRIRRFMAFTTPSEAEEFLASTVRPAMTQVADELGELGVISRVEECEVDGVAGLELQAEVGDETDFHYLVIPREAPIPSFGRFSSRPSDVYTRLEVHLRLGGQGYDIMGYSADQLIDDMLDQYERHLEYLRLHEGTLS